jgi:hypothetical protein
MTGITTDGATVMKKFGRLAKCHQQLCFVYGIQLAVIDVLYKKKEEDISLTLESDSKSDEDDKTDQRTTDYYEVEHNYADSDVSVIDELEPIIKKVRKIVKLFRKSPTKNDKTLQK